MQITAQEAIPLIEKSGSLAFFDIEATGTKGDYNSILVVTIKPWHKPPITMAVDRPGQDKKLAQDTRDLLEQYQCWCGYYSKGFDVPMIRTRLWKWGLRMLQPRHHIDMYYVLKASTITSRRSQAHLLELLETKQQKMTLSPSVWNEVLSNPDKVLKTLRARCESDCAGLESLYDKSKILIREITR